MKKPVSIDSMMPWLDNVIQYGYLHRFTIEYPRKIDTKGRCRSLPINVRKAKRMPLVTLKPECVLTFISFDPTGLIVACRPSQATTARTWGKHLFRCECALKQTRTTSSWYRIPTGGCRATTQWSTSYDGEIGPRYSPRLYWRLMRLRKIFVYAENCWIIRGALVSDYLMETNTTRLRPGTVNVEMFEEGAALLAQKWRKSFGGGGILWEWRNAYRRPGESNLVLLV